MYVNIDLSFIKDYTSVYSHASLYLYIVFLSLLVHLIMVTQAPFQFVYSLYCIAIPSGSEEDCVRKPDMIKIARRVRG